MLQADSDADVSSATADILDVAARCFQERGYQSTSIDEVARGVGATKGRIYYHFRSKSDLFAAVFRAGMEMLHAAVKPVIELDIPAAEKLRRMAHAHVSEMMRTQAYQRVVWQGVNMHLRGATTPDQREAFDELARTREAYGRLFGDTMEQARSEGAFSYGNPSVTLQVFLVSLNSPIIWYSPRPGQSDADIDRLAGEVVAFALAGLKQQEAA